MESNRPDVAAYAAQLVTLLKRNPLACIVLAGGVVLAVATLGHKAPSQEVLLSGKRFRADELAAVETAFARAGLQDYQIQDNAVSVPPQRKTAYLRALEEAKVLPQALSAPRRDAILASHPFESPAQRQARWQLAAEQELASYLRALEGIDDATVRFDEMQQDGLQPDQSIRAMVVVRPASGSVLVPERLQSICELVAASRVGMSPGDVTVLDLGSGHTYTSGATWTTAQRQEQFAHRKLTYESHWNKKLGELLAFIPKVSVATDVRLADDSLRPCGVQVVVTVPESYYQAVWRDQLHRQGSPLREPRTEELQEVHRKVEGGLQEIVGELFPLDASGQPIATVAVASVPDLPIVRDPAMPPWRMNPSPRVALILLVIVGCALTLAGFVRDCVAGVAATRSSSAARVEPGPARPDSGLAATEGPVHSEPIRSEREELVRLVRSNPAAAAATLRSWVHPTS